MDPNRCRPYYVSGHSGPGMSANNQRVTLPQDRTAQCISYQNGNPYPGNEPGRWPADNLDDTLGIGLDKILDNLGIGQGKIQDNLGIGQDKYWAVGNWARQNTGQPGNWAGQNTGQGWNWAGQNTGQSGNWAGLGSGQPRQWTGENVGQSGQRLGQNSRQCWEWRGENLTQNFCQIAGQNHGQIGPGYPSGQGNFQPPTTYPSGLNGPYSNQQSDNRRQSRSQESDMILRNAVVVVASAKSPCTCKAFVTTPYSNEPAQCSCEISTRTMGSNNLEATDGGNNNRPFWGSTCAPANSARRKGSNDSTNSSARSRSIHGASCLPCSDPENYRTSGKMGILVRTNGGTGQNCIPGRGGQTSRAESKLSLRFAPTDQVRDMSTTESLQPSQATCITDDEVGRERSEGSKGLSSKPPGGDDSTVFNTSSNPELAGYHMESDLDVQARSCDSSSAGHTSGQLPELPSCDYGPCAGYMIGPWPPPLEEKEEECICEEEEDEDEVGPPTREPCISFDCRQRGSSFDSSQGGICIPCPPRKPPLLDFRTFPRFGANRPKGGRLHLGKPPLGLEKRICPLLAVACPRTVGGPFAEGRLLLGKTPATCWAAAANGLNCHTICDAYVMTYPPTPDWYKEYLNCMLPHEPSKGRCLVCAGPPPPAILCKTAASNFEGPKETPLASCKQKSSKKKQDPEQIATCDFGFIVPQPTCEIPPYMEQITLCDLETKPPVISAPVLPQPSTARSPSKTGSSVGSAGLVGSKTASGQAVGSKIGSVQAVSASRTKSAEASLQAVGSKAVSAQALVGSKLGSEQAVGLPPVAEDVPSPHGVASAVPLDEKPLGSPQLVSSAQPISSPLPVSSTQATGSLQAAVSAQPVASAAPVGSATPVGSLQAVVSAAPALSLQAIASAAPAGSVQAVVSAAPAGSVQAVASAPVESLQAVGSAQLMASADAVGSAEPTDPAAPTGEGSNQAEE